MKKKILLLTTFIVAVFAVLCNVEKKEVKAEGNCETYYNYYLFLDATNKGYLLSLMGDDGFFDYRTGKDMPLGVPTGANILSKGPIFPGKSTDFPEWTLEYYYNTLKRISPGEVDYYTSNGTNSSYAMGYEWRNDKGELTDSKSLPSTYAEFAAGVPENLSTPIFDNMKISIGKTGIDSTSYFGINGQNAIIRTYNKTEIDKLTGDTVWSPAVYYVKYELCDGEEPEDTYTLTVEHFLDETSKKLEKDYKKSGYKTGESDSYNCPSIDGYTVVDNGSNKLSKHTFTFEDEDIKKQCYYKEKTYTLTINFGDTNEDCSKSIANVKSVTYDGLKAGQVQSHTIEKSYGDLNNPKLGIFSSQFETDPVLNDLGLTVTMPAKNVEVCIVYTPKTGASWIYLVWVIGGLALGYSVWYFVRYYKKQNSEI